MIKIFRDIGVDHFIPMRRNAFEDIGRIDGLSDILCGHRRTTLSEGTERKSDPQIEGSGIFTLWRNTAADAHRCRVN